MLPANARLRRREDFTKTVRRGRRAGRGSVVVYLLPSEMTDAGFAGSSDTSRAGFIVSKAVGNSVVRHRVARRLRHLMRDRLTLVPAGSCLVVRALPAAATRSHEMLGRDLDDALGRVLPRIDAA